MQETSRGMRAGQRATRWAVISVVTGVTVWWIGMAGCAQVADLGGYTFDLTDAGTGASSNGGTGGGQGGSAGSGGSDAAGGQGGGYGGRAGAAGNADAGGRDGGDGSAGTGDASPACTSCLNSSCRLQGMSCAGDPSCSLLNACAIACPDFTCVKHCSDTYSSGKDAYVAWVACRAVTCHDDCYGGSCSAADSTPCGVCINQSCLAPCLVCDYDLACTSVTQCQELCPNDISYVYLACLATCSSKYPSGQQKALDMYSSTSGCMWTRCGSQCK